MSNDVYLDAANFLTRVVPRGADEAQRLVYIIKLLEGHGTCRRTESGARTGTVGEMSGLLSS